MWLLYTYLIGIGVASISRVIQYGYHSAMNDVYPRSGITAWDVWICHDENGKEIDMPYFVVPILWPLVYSITILFKILPKLVVPLVKIGELIGNYQLKKLEQKKEVKVIKSKPLASCDNCGYPSKTGASR